MDKLDIIAKLKQEKVVAVVRAESKEQGEKIIDSIVSHSSFKNSSIFVLQCF